MSKEAITKVVQRAISDAGFRRQLSTDPTGALRGFDLSADEAAALRTGDAGRLSALGVDQRMSKAFALGGASVAATRAGGTDLSASAPNAFNAGGASAVRSADATGAGASSNNALASSSDANAALVDDGASSVRTIIPHQPDAIITADDGGAVGLSTAEADGSAARGNVIHDDPDGFLAANANADLSGAVRGSAINDDPDGFLAANANADLSGVATGETAFIDDSEGYLTKVGYDSNAATAAVSDAHDRGDGASVSAVSDAHDRGDGASVSAVSDAHDRGGDNIVTRTADDDATSAADSEGGTHISS
jgi:hypothetical protein